MIIQIDLQSETPIYMQLRNNIIEGIAAKELEMGEGLPSVRTMASDLGVNMQTVNKTYQMLKQDGFILIHRQKGVVINPESLPQVNDDFVAYLTKELRPLVAESICRDMEESQFTALCNQIYTKIINVKKEEI